MANLDRDSERPPLNPRDLYRPRLGKQREPLSKSAIMELQAWRKASAQSEGADAVEGTR